MSSQKVLCEPVPNLKNYGARRYKKHVALAVMFSATGSFLFYNFVTCADKKKIRDFYSTYDAEAAFMRMKNRGLFSCVDSGSK